MLRRATPWLLVWAGWTGLAVFFAISTSLTYISQDRTGSWAITFGTSLTQWWLWAALTPIVVWLARRFPLSARTAAWSTPLHLTAAVLIAVVKVGVEGRIRVWMFAFQPYLLISNIALQVLIYWAIVAATHALDHYGRNRTRAAEVEARLGQAQLDLLRAQLQPHFLFNALNAVSELVHEDPQRADTMLGQLSDLLRATLEAGERQEVTLDEELSLLGGYLAVQETRFGDRLHVRLDMPPECGAARVPHLLLQPLVENAIHHGIAPRALGGHVSITAHRRDSELVLAVADDGVGLPASGPIDGVGLTNTRGRLASLYGPAGSLAIQPDTGGGTRVTVRLPFRVGESDGATA